MLRHHSLVRFNNNALAGIKCFTSQTTFTKPRRRPRSTVLTQRDRQRLLLEQNKVRKTALTSRTRADDMMQLATSRLTWARDQVFQYWNPDFNQSSASTMPTATSTTQGKRPTRYLLVMDARWWAWNIAFALMPAIVIGLYCELVGQPNFAKYHEQQERQQLKQVLGEDADLEDFLQPSPPNIWQRVVRLGEEVKKAVEMMLVEGGFVLSSSTEDDKTNEQSNITSKVESNKTTDSKEQPHFTNTAETRAQIESAESSNTIVEEYDPATIRLTVEEMKRRLEQLENTLKEQESRKSPTKASIERQVEQLQQSGVSKRAEEQLVARVMAQVKKVNEDKENRLSSDETLHTTAPDLVSWWGKLWSNDEPASDASDASPRFEEENPKQIQERDAEAAGSSSSSKARQSPGKESEKPVSLISKTETNASEEPFDDKDKARRRPWWKVF